MNPGKKPQMLGAKAIIAIKHKRTTDVHTYEVTKETSKGCRLWPKSPSEFGLNVLDMQAWSNNTKQCTTLYAKLILPFPEYNIRRLNHV
ncbi:Auxin-responsive family protein [Arachis hypogaea]|nr:Auxin-responsive family protein [Arachis hypogaea]